MPTKFVASGEAAVSERSGPVGSVEAESAWAWQDRFADVSSVGERFRGSRCGHSSKICLGSYVGKMVNDG
jgi:hypothetical protein